MAADIPPRYRARRDLLNGRVVLVTGAGSGLGRAAAISYAAHGANVVLGGRDIAKLERVYDEIERAGSPDAFICPLDLAALDAAAQSAAHDAVRNSFGRLDGVLHAAATLGRRTPLEQFPIDVWQATLQVNLTGAFALTQCLLPLLKRADDASVLFTVSDAGRPHGAYWGAYAVSQRALEGLASALAAELERTSSVRVNSVDPGAVDTPLRRAALPAEPAASRPHPQRRMAAYLYLMGPDSLGVSGRRFNA